MSESLLVFEHDDSNRRRTSAPKGGDHSKARWVEDVFYADDAITAGQWVSIDLAETSGEGAYRSVVPSAAAKDAEVVGVALEAAADGEWLRVLRAGIITPDDSIDVEVETGVAAGDALEIGATAGRARALTAGSDGEAVGVNLELAASNVSNWVDVRCM